MRRKCSYPRRVSQRRNNTEGLRPLISWRTHMILIEIDEDGNEVEPVPEIDKTTMFICRRGGNGLKSNVRLCHFCRKKPATMVCEAPLPPHKPIDPRRKTWLSKTECELPLCTKCAIRSKGNKIYCPRCKDKRLH